MNKGKGVIKNILCIVTIILIAITSFSLTNVSKANTDNVLEDNNTPTGDRTFIRLVHTAENNKVEVYLEVADTTVPNDNEEVNSSVSVRAFQIGLNIEIDLETEGSSINFDFADKLKDELSCETKKVTQNSIINPTTNKKAGERLNIYYVGNKDLNDARDNKNNTKDGIKIGTITFEGIKKLETASIIPDGEFTKIVSTGHTLAETNITEDDGLYQMIINPTVSEENPENPEGGSQGGSGDETDEGTGDVEGSGSENGGSSSNQEAENQGSGTNIKVPGTGDIGIGIFVALMVISLIGMILLLKNKRSKHSK